MLHELIVALYGCDGDIFVLKEDGCLSMVDHLTFVSPSEACLMNRLCNLGAYYRRFQQFVQHYARPIGGRDGGLYLSSFAFALNEALEPYRHSLASLESELLEDPHMSLSYIQSRLEEYQLFFPTLWAIIEHIIHNKTRGCHLLDVIYKNIPYGLPSVRESLATIMRQCHKVFYRQLSAWIFRGMLMDTYKEFFIREITDNTQDPNEEVPDRSDEQPLIDKLSKDEMKRLTGEEQSLTTRNHFMLRADMLPSYIPASVAERILFIGESVHLFACDAMKQTRNEGFDALITDLESQFAARLHALGEDKEFSLLKLQEIVDEVRVFVNERLWTLLVVEHDLIGHLHQVKDIYLFGRGELYQTFIDMAKPILEKKPTASTGHDINVTFHQAARAVLLDDDSLAEHFRLIVDLKRKTEKRFDDEEALLLGSLDNGWNYLQLKYNVRWPFHILFSPQTIEKYGEMFKFLLMVKRTQLALQNIWILQNLSKNRNDVGTRHSKESIMRNHMAFLVDNLQYYLQVDVLESQFSQLTKTIMTTKDVEQIQQAHECFINSLLGQSFMYNKPIYNCLSKILAVCLNMNETIDRCSDPERMCEKELKLGRLQGKFQRESALLFRILSNVQHQLQTSPHLAQLLLRLDFNRFFSASGGELGGTS